MLRSTLLAALVLLGLASPASAFSFETTVTEGCHERITLDALDAVGWPDGRTPPPVTRRDRLLAEGLPTDLDGRDLWAISLVIGARYPDLGAHTATDAPALASLHGNSARQRNHCLRARGDDGEAGNESALASCRAAIVEELESALGDDPDLDIDEIEHIHVALAFEGETDVALSRYAFHLGQALHTLQDSFTHTYRSADGDSVHHVLNFLEWTGSSSYSPSRDGEAHDVTLDQCSGDEISRTRAERATRASTELFRALDAEDRETALAAATTVIERWIAYEPGCERANDYCDAPERDLDASCAASPVTSGRAWTLLVLVALSLLARRARRIAPILALLFFATTAQAQPEIEPAHIEYDDVGHVSLLAAVAASIDHGGFAYRGGARVQIAQHFALAVEVEHNPWFSAEVGNVVPGTVNAFASLSVRWVRLGKVELQSTAMLGASLLLFSTYATDAGSIGPFVGLSLLGIAITFDRHFALVLEPAEVMVPVPRVTGIPLIYRQYRATVGVRWTF